MWRARELKEITQNTKLKTQNSKLKTSTFTFTTFTVGARTVPMAFDVDDVDTFSDYFSSVEEEYSDIPDGVNPYDPPIAHNQSSDPMSVQESSEHEPNTQSQSQNSNSKTQDSNTQKTNCNTHAQSNNNNELNKQQIQSHHPSSDGAESNNIVSSINEAQTALPIKPDRRVMMFGIILCFLLILYGYLSCRGLRPKFESIISPDKYTYTIIMDYIYFAVSQCLDAIFIYLCFVTWNLVIYAIETIFIFTVSWCKCKVFEYVFVYNKQNNKTKIKDR